MGQHTHVFLEGLEVFEKDKVYPRRNEYKYRESYYEFVAKI